MLLKKHEGRIGKMKGNSKCNRAPNATLFPERKKIEREARENLIEHASCCADPSVKAGGNGTLLVK